MKKLAKTLLLILCLAPAFGTVAYADVIVSPVDVVADAVPSVLLIALAVIACAVLVYILRKRRGK